VADPTEQHPYRSGPPHPVSALARLASKGRKAKHDLEQMRREVDGADHRMRLGHATRVGNGFAIFLVFKGATWLIGGLGLLAGGVVVFSGSLRLYGLAAMAAFFALAALLVIGGRALTRRRIAAELAWPAKLPFTVEGYEAWLAADFGYIVVDLDRPADRQVVADAVLAVDPKAAVAWQGASQLFVTLTPNFLWGSDDSSIGTYGGDPRLFRKLAQRILVPLHTEHGVRRAELRVGQAPRGET
jgi:hypothetical protein